MSGVSQSSLMILWLWGFFLSFNIESLFGRFLVCSSLFSLQWVGHLLPQSKYWLFLATLLYGSFEKCYALWCALTGHLYVIKISDYIQIQIQNSLYSDIAMLSSWMSLFSVCRQCGFHTITLVLVNPILLKILTQWSMVWK